MDIKKEVHIGKVIIGEGYPAYIIAEVSCNHMLDKAKAEELIRAAARAGANAIKLQTYTADTMTIDCDKPPFRVGGEDNPDTWKGQTLYSLYKEAYTPWEWQKDLQTLAHSLGIELFSTPFDPTAVEFLEKELNPPCYKVASYELTDDTLLRAIAKTNKPVIISNGYATLEELEHAMELLTIEGVKDIIILYCVTEYSTGPTTKGVNLATIRDIEKRFATPAGFSDNNGGIDIPVMSVLCGAVAIEKHLIENKDDPSHDQRFSVVESELKDMIDQIRAVETLSPEAKQQKLESYTEWQDWVGEPVFGPTSDLEQYNRRWRRSIFVVKDVEEGDEVTEEAVRVIRPEGGLSPRYYTEVLGKHFTKRVSRGEPLDNSMLQ